MIPPPIWPPWTDVVTLSSVLTAHPSAFDARALKIAAVEKFIEVLETGRWLVVSGGVSDNDDDDNDDDDDDDDDDDGVRVR